MGTEDILTKLNIKDYGRQLEKIIEKKFFSEDAKNLLLQMFYKVETSYDDFNKVKVDTMPKKDVLEEIQTIIENDCKYIELVKPNLEKDEILKDRKSLAVRKDRKVISYPNERAIIYAIYDVNRHKFEVSKEYPLIKKSMEEMLNLGSNMDKSEIIRDFDAWSWNVDIDDMEDLTVNLIYNNLQMLVGNKFLNDWKMSFGKEDYISLCKDKLQEEYTSEIGKKLYKLICQNAMLVCVSKSVEERERLIQEQKDLEKQLAVMEDKKKYVQDIVNRKKQIEKDIRKIDEILNDNATLKREFINRNKGLKEERRIFSLSDLSETMGEERDRLIANLKECSKLMDPMNYIDEKAVLTEKVELLKELDLENKKSPQQQFIIALQNEFLKAFESNIKKANTKKETIDLLYKYRYYKLLPLDSKTLIKDLKEIHKENNKIEKMIITKACNLKILNILSINVEVNFKLISNLLNTRIIDLDEAIIELKKKDEKTIIYIYEDKMVETSKEYDYIEDLNVKYDKKIRLFIK